MIAALGRLGMLGGWDCIRAGEALDGLDRADADLLLAAGMLERTGIDRFTVTDDDLVDLDGTTVGHAMVAHLRRALEHTERRSAGWDGATVDTVLSQGRGSRAAADHIARDLLPRMPGSRDALQSGTSRFLDVGVGVAAIAARLCQLYPGLTCVGVDVLPEVLRLGAAELTGLGLADRVELRQQSVSELSDEEAFDLAWLPQPFIPRTAFEPGVDPGPPRAAAQPVDRGSPRRWQRVRSLRNGRVRAHGSRARRWTDPGRRGRNPAVDRRLRPDHAHLVARPDVRSSPPPLTGQGPHWAGCCDCAPRRREIAVQRRANQLGQAFLGGAAPLRRRDAP